MIVFFRLLSFLPLAFLHVLGVIIGWLTWAFSPTYRAHLRHNMQLALGAQGAAKNRSAVIASTGKAALELAKIWLRPLPEVSARVLKISGGELIDEAQKTGTGIIYLTPHLGCFEITAQYLSTRAPITVLYRPPKLAWLQTLIEMGRKREQLRIAAADLAGVRTLLKALKRGEAVGLLPDQAPRAGEGRWLNFFGKPAYTMTLAARLSASGAQVIMVWAERLPNGAGYHIHLSAPVHAIEGTTEERAEKINAEIEHLILQCPQQYLWGYNRYKHPSGAEKPPAQSQNPKPS